MLQFHPNRRFIGDLEERSFTCEQLVRVDIAFEKGSKDHPVLNNLVELLRGNGITSDRIVIQDKIFTSILDQIFINCSFNCGCCTMMRVLLENVTKTCYQINYVRGLKNHLFVFGEVVLLANAPISKLWQMSMHIMCQFLD